MTKDTKQLPKTHRYGLTTRCSALFVNGDYVKIDGHFVCAKKHRVYIPDETEATPIS